jgi:hypothetical protein
MPFSVGPSLQTGILADWAVLLQSLRSCSFCYTNLREDVFVCNPLLQCKGHASLPKILDGSLNQVQPMHFVQVHANTEMPAHHKPIQKSTNL